MMNCRAIPLIMLLGTACEPHIVEPPEIEPHPIVGDWTIKMISDYGFVGYQTDATMSIYASDSFYLDFIGSTYISGFLGWSSVDSANGYAFGGYEMLSDSIIILKAQTSIHAQYNLFDPYLLDTLFMDIQDSLLIFSLASQIDSTHFEPTGRLFIWERQP